MLRKLKNYLNALIEARSGAGDDELFLYLVLTGAVWFSIAVHTGLAIVLFGAGAPILPLLNLGCLGVCLLCHHLIEHGKSMQAGLIMSLDIILYAVASTAVLGLGTFTTFYYFVVLAM